MKIRFILCKDNILLYRDVELEFIPPIGYEVQIKFGGQSKITICEVIHGKLYIDNTLVNETMDKIVGRNSFMCVCNVKFIGELNG